MGFNFLSFITGWFSSIPTTEHPKIKEAVAKVKEQFPDDQDAQIDALVTDLKDILAPYLDVNTSLNTLEGIAKDILSGTAGVDKDAWMGSV